MTVKETLIAEAEKLGLPTKGLTIAQLKDAIKAHKDQSTEDSQPPHGEEDGSQTTQPDPKIASEEETRFAKAGKRSKKQVEATEAEALRQKKKQEDTPTLKPKPVKPTRSKLERRSKKYKEAVKEIDKQKVYNSREGLVAILKTSTTKFDSSVDLVVALGVNTKLAEQNIRDFVVLPEGLGKTLRVAVFADDVDCQKALKAGARVAGNDIFLQQLDKEVIDFDILITRPELMVKLSKYAKFLGPRGLMPNHKSGTIVKDIPRAVEQALAGRVEYRVDDNGLVHLPIGKVSFQQEKLSSNLEAVLRSIKGNKPVGLKGVYIKKMYLSTTMGPSLEIKLAE